MYSARKQSSKNKGFTLIELLIVMAIIGILATIGVGFFVSAQQKTRDAERKSDLRQIANALEIFYADHGHYPLSNGGRILACQYLPAIGSGIGTGQICNWNGSDVFADTTGRTYFSPLTIDPGSGEYYYRANTTGTMYQLYATLENDNDPEYQTFAATYASGSSSCGGSTCHYAITSPNTTANSNLTE